MTIHYHATFNFQGDSMPSKLYRISLILGLVLAGAAPPIFAQAPAPNLTLIRRNATISQIDDRNISAWVESQLDALFNSNNLDQDGPKFRAALLDHFQANDATPAFRQVLARSVAESLAKRYKGKTSLTEPNLPHPLPVVYGVTYTRWQILFYTVLLVAVTVLPWATKMSGVFYLGGALVLGGVFLYYAIRLLNPPSELYAMQVFNYSIIYLMALFAFLLADHWLLPPIAPVAAPALEFVPTPG